MADKFLRSTDGNDGDNGSSWALAKATLAGAIAVMSAGDTLYVSKDHAESIAGAVTFTLPGTAAAPCRILCVDDTGDPANPTTLATTATVARTGAGGSINFAGHCYIYGVSFTPGTSSTCNLGWSSGSSTWWVCESCNFQLATTGGSSVVVIGAASAPDNRLEWINCNMTFGAAGQIFQFRGSFLWRGGAITGATLPTVPFTPGTGEGCDVEIRGVDLSALAAGKSLVNPSTATAPSGVVKILNCKLNAAVAVTSAAPAGPGGPRVVLDNSDSGDTNYRMYHETYRGSVASETTLVRTSGATDGTTPLSWKMLSTANVWFKGPLRSPDIFVWHDTPGSAITVTVEILHDSLTKLTDAEVWLEAEYAGTLNLPLSLFASDAAASVLATAADQAASAVTWTTTGLTNPNKQALVVTMTPREKGWIRLTVNLAKASYTVYVDPKATIA